MKKRSLTVTSVTMACCLALSLLSGCSTGGTTKETSTSEKQETETVAQTESEETETEKEKETEKETEKATEKETEKPTEKETEKETEAPGIEPVVPFDYSSEYVLKDIYADDFLVGTIYNYFTSNDSRAWEQFNVWTAENNMKPDAIYRSNKVNLNDAKNILKLADEKGVDVHGHVFVWHQQTPSSLSSGTREEAIQKMHDYMYEVMTGLDDGIISWDVVNEAIADGATLPADGNWRKCLRDCPWKRSIGEDYLEIAFTTAAQIAEENNIDVKLYYNDYNLDNYNKAQIAAAMAKDMMANGIRIDGIGMQGHYTVTTSPENVETSIKMFRDAGVKSIVVSELDVGTDGLNNGTLSKEQEIRQAQVLAQLFRIYKENSDLIDRVTFWGHMDAQSWRSEKAPSLYNKKGEPKEAFYAVANPDAYLASYPPVDMKTDREATAVKGTPVIDGEIDDVWNNTVSYSVKKQLTAWEGATADVRVLYDSDYYYVLMEVKDPVLDDSSANAYEQDSVEIFLDQTNDKTPFLGYDDGQYRVNYKGETSVGTIAEGTEAYLSAAKVVDGGYVVEIAIPAVSHAYAGKKLGFEVQVNDAKDGARQSIAKFNDGSDNSYSSAAGWGTVILK